MKELQAVENVLLIIVALTLIGFAANDMILTAKQLLNFQTKRNTSNKYLVRFFISFFRDTDWSFAIQKRLFIIVPFLQILIWKVALIAGFAFLYYTFGWQPENEIMTKDKTDDFSDALLLSLIIPISLVLYQLPLENPNIVFLAQIQLYLSFLFIGFVCFYLIKLRKKTKELKPHLFNLQYQIKEDCYSPFVIANSLKQYDSANLLLILKDWEFWSEKLRINFRQHPFFIYGGINYERNLGWLPILNIILEVSAALIITSEGATEKRARKTFAAARQTLIETADLINKKLLKNKTDEQKKKVDDFDKVLSAELVFENDEVSHSLRQNEMLSVWRFTYEKDLNSLAKEIKVKMPAIKFDEIYC